MEAAKNTLMSRTNWVAIATAVLGLSDYFMPFLSQDGRLPSWSLTVLGGVMMGLRQFTTAPVSIKAPVASGTGG